MVMAPAAGRREERTRAGSTKGFTVVEMVVAVAVLGVFLFVVLSRERETIQFDRSMRLDLFTHPDKSAVLSRMRRDVLDAKSYPKTYLLYEQDSDVLILKGLDESGEKETVVVYDFREEAVAKRIEYLEGEKVTEWMARKVPQYEVDSYSINKDEGPYFVRLKAFDAAGKLVVDQIMIPRAL